MAVTKSAQEYVFGNIKRMLEEQDPNRVRHKAPPTGVAGVRIGGGGAYGNSVTGYKADPNAVNSPSGAISVGIGGMGGFGRQQYSRRPSAERVRQIGQMVDKQQRAGQVSRNLEEYRSQQEDLMERLQKMAAGENLYSDRAADASATAMGQAALGAAASGTGGRRAYGAASGQAQKLAGGARSLVNNRMNRMQEMDAARQAIAELQAEKYRFESGLADVKLSEQQQRLSQRIGQTKTLLQMMDLMQSDVAAEQRAQQSFQKAELLDEYDAFREMLEQQEKYKSYATAALNALGKGATMISQYRDEDKNGD